jgi:hypothetical protein
LVFALGAAAYVQKFFHGVLSKGNMVMHLEKTPPPCEGRGFKQLKLLIKQYYQKQNYLQ